MLGDAVAHQPSNRFAEIAMMTAALTLAVFIIPTIILTRMARSRGSGSLAFNRLVLVLLSAIMMWTVVYAAVV